MRLARLGALLMVAAWTIGPLAACSPHKAPTVAERPSLLLLTSLPIVFGEDFSLEADKSPVLRALEHRFKVVPISNTAPAELSKGELLLMAQPRAQRAEDLVALDQWVRSGGSVVLLADPALEWPSERPLGDPLRPPPMFADTGLLAHWGLRLDTPDERGPKALRLGKYEIVAGSPGKLVGNSCGVSSDGLAAHCNIGTGRATIVADADFLNVASLDGPAGNNLDALVAELNALLQ